MTLSNFTILLVEDDSNDAVLLQRAFKKAEISTMLQVATDGEEATAYLKGEGKFGDRSQFPFPSLMLLDLKLPRKSGLEVLAWTREQNDEIKNMPVIVLTSSRQTTDIDEAYSLGANSYMAKPEGNFEGLAEMVKSLERARGGE